jgi:hypothetical protein
MRKRYLNLRGKYDDPPTYLTANGIPVVNTMPEIVVTGERMSPLKRFFNKNFRTAEGWDKYITKNDDLTQERDAIQVNYNPELIQQWNHEPRKDGNPTQRAAYFDQFRRNQKQGLYTLTDEDGNITGTTTSYNQYLNNQDRPLSPVDPIAEFYVGGKALTPVFTALGRGAQWGLAKMGNRWARNQIAGRTFNNAANRAFGLDNRFINTPVSTLAYEAESNTIKNSGNPRTYLGLFERPNNLSIAERFGINKADRNLLTENEL